MPAPVGQAFRFATYEADTIGQRPAQLESSEVDIETERNSIRIRGDERLPGPAPDVEYLLRGGDKVAECDSGGWNPEQSSALPGGAARSLNRPPASPLFPHAQTARQRSLSLQCRIWDQVG